MRREYTIDNRDLTTTQLHISENEYIVVDPNDLLENSFENDEDMNEKIDVAISLLKLAIQDHDDAIDMIVAIEDLANDLKTTKI